MNKSEKVEAILAATKAKYSLKVEDFEERIRDFAANHYVSLTENVKANTWYKSLPVEYKEFVKTVTDMFSYYTNRNKHSEQFLLNIPPKLKIGRDGVVHPFNTFSNCVLIFTFPVVLLDETRIPTDIAEKWQKERRDLNDEIETFMQELYTVIMPITTEKKLAETLPNMVKYFTFASEGTSLVNVELQNKLNEALV